MPKWREQLQSMSFTEKVDHIWEYYKLHIIGSIAVIFILISIINGILGKEDLFHVTIISENWIAEEQDAITEYMNNEFTELNFYIDYMKLSEEGIDSLSNEDIQRFGAQYTTGEIDVFILDRQVFNELMDEQALLLLNEFFPIDNPSENIRIYTDQLGDIYGIDTLLIPIFNEYTSLHDKILSVPVTTHEEKFEEFITLINGQ